MTKKNLLQAKCAIYSFYVRGLNLIRICIIVHSIVVVLVVKSPPANAGDVTDVGWIPGSRRTPGGEHGNPLQCSCLENPLDRGAWWAAVRGSQRVGHSWRDLACRQSTFSCHVFYSI